MSAVCEFANRVVLALISCDVGDGNYFAYLAISGGRLALPAASESRDVGYFRPNLRQLVCQLAGGGSQHFALR